jgi:ABC-type phosphate transport system permease subunit
MKAASTSAAATVMKVTARRGRDRSCVISGVLVSSGRLARETAAVCHGG